MCYTEGTLSTEKHFCWDILFDDMVLAIFIKDQPSNQKPKVEPSQARNFYSIHMAASVLGPLLGEATFFAFIQ